MLGQENRGGASVHLVNLTPGVVMVDTGCRSACGGKRWHQELQDEMTRLDRPFYEEPQDEVFQFGPGKPIYSKRRWVDEVGVHNQIKRLVCSELPVECPGLVSPDVLAEWDAVLNFAQGTMSIGEGSAKLLKASKSGHPVVRLTDFPAVNVEAAVTKVVHTIDGGGSEADLEEGSSAETDADTAESKEGSSTSQSSDHAWTSPEEESDQYEDDETFYDADERIMQKGRR